MKMMKLREKSIIVLEALFIGQIVNLHIGQVGLSENCEFYIKGQIERNKKKQDVELSLREMTAENFIKICNKLTDDEAFIIAAQTALMKGKIK